MMYTSAVWVVFCLLEAPPILCYDIAHAHLGPKLGMFLFKIILNKLHQKQSTFKLLIGTLWASGDHLFPSKEGIESPGAPC